MFKLYIPFLSLIKIILYQFIIKSGAVRHFDQQGHGASIASERALKTGMQCSLYHILLQFLSYLNCLNFNRYCNVKIVMGFIVSLHFIFYNIKGCFGL
jgi:hypothetical protein